MEGKHWVTSRQPASRPVTSSSRRLRPPSLGALVGSHGFFFFFPISVGTWGEAASTLSKADLPERRMVLVLPHGRIGMGVRGDGLTWVDGHISLPACGTCPFLRSGRLGAGLGPRNWESCCLSPSPSGFAIFYGAITSPSVKHSSDCRFSLFLPRGLWHVWNAFLSQDELDFTLGALL